jgi:hypothetical protein
MVSKKVRREIEWDYLLCTESDALLAGLHLALLVLVVFPNIDKVRAYIISVGYRRHRGGGIPLKFEIETRFFLPKSTKSSESPSASAGFSSSSSGALTRGF